MPFDPNDPDTKAALKAAVEEAVEDATTKLDAKNKELLGDLKKTKADLRKVSEIKPEDVAAIEADNEKLRADLAAAAKTAKEATAAAEKATKALETESGFTRKLLVENGLKDTLIKGGVKDEDFLDALVTKFSQGAQIVSEGDVRKAMLGDKELSAVVGEYLTSDAGKKFVAAPVNGGGGAHGSKLKADAKTMTRTAFNALDQNAKAEAGMQSAKGELQITEG